MFEGNESFSYPSIPDPHARRQEVTIANAIPKSAVNSLKGPSKKGLERTFPKNNPSCKVTAAKMSENNATSLLYVSFALSK